MNNIRKKELLFGKRWIVVANKLKLGTEFSINKLHVFLKLNLLQADKKKST